MIRAEHYSLPDLSRWFFRLCESHPEIYSYHDLAQLWVWSRRLAGLQDGDLGMTEKIPELAGYLRAALLKRAYQKANGCTACPLHEHRLKGRGVFADGCYENDPFTQFGEKADPIGPVHAEIMVVGEGPGEFESRTGQPLVSYQVLSGSLCARECGSYELCFNHQAPFPLQPCKPKPLRKPGTLVSEELIQIRTTRANAPVFKIQTAGEKLDHILVKTGYWRESWNSRQHYREGLSEKAQPKDGTVFITNTIKCRSCKPNPKASDGLEDRTPTKKEVDACRQWLDLQLYIVQPRVIVALGNTAIGELAGLPDPRVLTHRGTIYKGPLDIPVIADVHPSFIIRQSDTKLAAKHTQLLEETFRIAQSIARGEHPLPWEQDEEAVSQETAGEPAPAPAVEQPEEEAVALAIESPRDAQWKETFR